MSYGSGRERRKRLKAFKQIDDNNARRFLELAANEFAGDYTGLINERASDSETQTDRDFLSSVASKNLTGAFAAYQRDVNSFGMSQILQKIVRENMDIQFSDIPDNIQSFLNGPEARGIFLDSSRAGIRRILQAPIQLGISRTVLQKYLQ